MSVGPCLVCKKPDHEKPMCFRGTDWCSENHRKILMGEIPVKPAETEENDGEQQA